MVTPCAQVYSHIVKAASDKKEMRDGAAFKMMPFECSSNGPPLHRTALCSLGA